MPGDVQAEDFDLGGEVRWFRMVWFRTYPCHTLSAGRDKWLTFKKGSVSSGRKLASLFLGLTGEIRGSRFVPFALQDQWQQLLSAWFSLPHGDPFYQT